MTTKAKGKAMMTEDEIILDLARRVDAMEPYTRALVMQRMDQRLRTIPCRRKSLLAAAWSSARCTGIRNASAVGNWYRTGIAIALPAHLVVPR